MPQRKGSLGRGLEALMGDSMLEDTTPSAIDKGALRTLPLADIDTNAGQPRKYFDEKALEALASSIRAHGVLQPVIVRPGEINGRYRLIAGERRFRAARLAGLTEIPAVIQQVMPRAAMELALVENIQRQDLNPIETAVALQELVTQHNLTQEEAAARVGMSRPQLANLIRLLQLPQPLQQALAEGRITTGHARALFSAPPALQQKLLARIEAEDLSVRQVEEAVRLGQLPAKAQKPKDDGLAFKPLVEALRKKFGLKTQVDGTLNKGKITLRYSSREELERMLAILGDDERP
nr:ParB/RepB/Spo0J family partition protein [bacterium]